MIISSSSRQPRREQKAAFLSVLRHLLQMKVELHIVRHGIRLDAEDSTWRSTAAVPTDPPLSRRGIAQAKEVGHYLSSRDVEMIFTSPYLRTLQTATSISSCLPEPLPILMEPGLREWVHRPNFPSTLHLSKEQALQRFPLIDDSYAPSFPCAVTAENEQQLQVRCNKYADHFSQYVKKLHVPKTSEERTLSIVLVTHAATAICLIRAFLQNMNMPIRVATCSVTTLTFDTEVPSCWELSSQATVDHLTEGSQCAWGFEDMIKRGSPSTANSTQSTVILTDSGVKKVSSVSSSSSSSLFPQDHVRSIRV